MALPPIAAVPLSNTSNVISSGRPGARPYWFSSNRRRISSRRCLFHAFASRTRPPPDSASGSGKLDPPPFPSSKFTATPATSDGGAAAFFGPGACPKQNGRATNATTPNLADVMTAGHAAGIASFIAVSYIHMLRRHRLPLVALLSLAGAAAQEITPPEKFFGFPLGAD